MNDAAHAGALGGNRDDGRQQGVRTHERGQVLHVRGGEAGGVHHDLRAGEGFGEGIDDALQLFCLVDNAVYVKGAGGEAGRFNGIDADPLCVQTRNDGGANKAAGANDFPPGFGHVFTSQKPAVGAGKNRVISTFAYLHRLW